MNSILKAAAKRISRLVSRRPRLVFALQECWLRLGYEVLDLKLAAWVIRRPEWLREKSQRRLASLEPELEASKVESDIARRMLRQHRMIEQHGALRSELVPHESMWGVLRQEHYGQLRKLVETGDVLALSCYLSKVFRTSTVNGYSYGTTFDEFPHRWAYLPVAIELSIVTFAECLGIIRAETHEQGKIAYWRLQYTEDQLIQQIEARMGFRIEAPRYGDPRGIMFGGRFVVRETFSHLYTAYRVRELLERNGLRNELNIVEIGGGYGGTCYWLRRLLGERIRRYVIVDLPEVGLVQSYFLGSGDPDALRLFGEPESTSRSTIELVPHFQLHKLSIQANVLINQDSMPEMPESEVLRYLKWGAEHVTGIFLSFNQEAYSPWRGELQVLVPSVASRIPNFRRISRETSWDRRGYVEETYLLNMNG